MFLNNCYFSKQKIKFDKILRTNNVWIFILFLDQQNSLKNEHLSLDDDRGIDVDNDDDLPMIGDMDSGDHDDMNGRPRKIRR